MSDGKDEKRCDKPGCACAACRKQHPPRYWCEVCEQAVPEKRCPSCGLKARRIR